MFYSMLSTCALVIAFSSKVFTLSSIRFKTFGCPTEHKILFQLHCSIVWRWAWYAMLFSPNNPIHSQNPDLKPSCFSGHNLRLSIVVSSPVFEHNTPKLQHRNISNHNLKVPLKPICTAAVSVWRAGYDQSDASDFVFSSLYSQSGGVAELY